MLEALSPGAGDNAYLDQIAYNDLSLWAVTRTCYYPAPTVAVVLVATMCVSA